jgi:hypothetical protein
MSYMELARKNILLVSPEPWNHIFVSKHHYATHLAKRGNQVFFLGPLFGQYLIEKTSFENVFTVTYPGFAKGLRYYPSLLQKYFIREQFDQLQKLCKVKFDIIWSFDNSVFFDFSALPLNVLKFSHIVDLNQDFQTEKAAKTADYCFCTTQFIKDRLLKYNSKVFKINHGFNNPGIDSFMVTLPGKSKVKALYAGNLAIPFIDWVLLYAVVRGNPEVDFIFIGPNAKVLDHDKEQDQAKKELLLLNNTFFLDRLNSSELFRYQSTADILLVVYKEQYHANQTANPHKMMEYLGSGKMIVATRTLEYLELHDEGLLLMTKFNREFIDLFRHAVERIDVWNNAEMQAERKAYAQKNTYDVQISRIENIIKTK